MIDFLLRSPDHASASAAKLRLRRRLRDRNDQTGLQPANRTGTQMLNPKPLTLSPFTPYHPCSPSPLQPFSKYLLHRRRQLGAHIGIADFAQRLGLGRVRMNRRRQDADALLRRDRQRQLAEHLAGVARDDGAAENSTSFLVVVNPGKTFRLAVEDRPVDIGATAA